MNDQRLSTNSEVEFRGEENADRWHIGVRHLAATTTGIAVAMPFLMVTEPFSTAIGVVILFATLCGLVNAGSQSGSFLRGFAFGFWVPLLIVLYLAVIFCLH